MLRTWGAVLVLAVLCAGEMSRAIPVVGRAC